MYGIHDLGLFIVAGLLLAVTPGVDFLYVLGRASSRGFAAGVLAALGIAAGCVVHITAAAVGLSALLASSAAAFTLVKWIGAAYLIWLGVTMLWQRKAAAAALPAVAPPSTTGGRVFWQGFLTNVLNPKVALFFLAFVPQFIAADSPAKVQAFLLLGAIFNFNATLWNLFVAWAAAFLAQRLAAASHVRLWLDRCLGGLFIALGVRLAAAQRG